MRISSLEKKLLGKGYCYIAGVDEAGRGAWAGPVVAGAVILPLDNPEICSALAEVCDSKKLRPEKREELFELISSLAVSWGAGFVPPERINRVGIARATREAMALAISQLNPPPQFLLIDYFRLPEISIPQEAVTSGDALCLSIAAASIIAKVLRDQWMAVMEELFPGYGFSEHKGYGTPQHWEALKRLGPCPIHRLSFAPLKLLHNSFTELQHNRK
ncbi:MAG: ribonuclease HII [Anaerolineae bacterium]|nr:ribonuclease HII [Anaerolineae bacterium]MDW8102394.1 ribonuclease HII [Anaerolineae bacterium]